MEIFRLTLFYIFCQITNRIPCVVLSKNEEKLVIVSELYHMAIIMLTRATTISVL